METILEDNLNLKQYINKTKTVIDYQNKSYNLVTLPPISQKKGRNRLQ